MNASRTFSFACPLTKMDWVSPKELYYILSSQRLLVSILLADSRPLSQSGLFNSCQLLGGTDPLGLCRTAVSSEPSCLPRAPAGGPSSSQQPWTISLLVGLNFYTGAAQCNGLHKFPFRYIW